MDRIDEYLQDEGLNQSFLKSIIGLSYEEDEFIKPGSMRSMENGSIVDAIITYPEGLDKFLIVEQEKRPSEMMEKIVTRVYKSRSSDDLRENIEQLTESIELIGYKGNANWNIDQRINKVIEDTAEYWDHLITSEGKTVVLTKEYEKAEYIANKLLTSEISRNFFKDSLTQIVHKQLPVYWYHKGQRCKALLDLAIENVKNKTIQPIDIKVTYSVNEFKYTARKFRYDFQGSFYKDGLQANYPEYKVLPFVNLAVSFHQDPYLYIHSDNDYYIGRYGARRMKTTTYTPIFEIVEEDVIYGYEDCIDIHLQSKELGLDNYDLESYNNQRIKQLNVWE